MIQLRYAFMYEKIYYYDYYDSLKCVKYKVIENRN
jgi:hypothetical protein